MRELWSKETKGEIVMKKKKDNTSRIETTNEEVVNAGFSYPVLEKPYFSYNEVYLYSLHVYGLYK